MSSAAPCLCARLRQGTRRLSAHYDAALAPLGINIAQYSLLRNIGALAPVSLTDLGRATSLERSTIGRNVRVLQRDGLVAAVRSDGDQRAACIELTPAGRDCLRRALPLWQRCQREIRDRLGPERVDTLLDVLSAL
ncbi:MAG: MarR family transcriptional regulator [Proteobacteria bacterium]|nr:MarR family transcriptional regulator [Pseudomonadota bacterium]